MFNDKYGLTRAVLDGRKTMTRRIIKCPKVIDGKDVYGLAIVRHPNSREVIECLALDEEGGEICNILPKYKVGEVVAVAQCYKDAIQTDGLPHPLVARPGWTNKMFVKSMYMPHQIRITNVRIEMLQDINPQDCIAEGIRLEQPFGYTFDNYGNSKYSTRYNTSPVGAFAALIDRTCGEGTWKKNPLCVRIRI